MRIRKDQQGGVTLYDHEGRREDLEWKLKIQNHHAAIANIQQEILELQERIDKRKAKA